MSCNFVADFSHGLDKPRWNFVDPAYYNSRQKCEEILTLGPLFNVPPRAEAFSLVCELRGAEFDKKAGDPLYDGQPPAVHPLSYHFLSTTQVELTWNAGVEWLDWGRWILRFVVFRKKERRSLFLGFTSMSGGTRESLSSAIAAGGEEFEVVAEPSDPQAGSEVTCRIDMKLGLHRDGTPRFGGLFNDALDACREAVGVYPEPLFTVKQTGAAIELWVETPTGIRLAGTEPSLCNPATGKGEALALAWRGVTDPKPYCKPPVARGFVGSWRGPEDDNGKARIDWCEPRRIDPVRSVASFFFGTEPSSEAAAGQPSLLVDPTMVYEGDSAPGGSPQGVR